LVYPNTAKNESIWQAALNTKYFIDPEEELIFVGMTQIRGFNNGYFWERLEALMYGALED